MLRNTPSNSTTQDLHNISIPLMQVSPELEAVYDPGHDVNVTVCTARYRQHQDFRIAKKLSISLKNFHKKREIRINSLDDRCSNSAAIYIYNQIVLIVTFRDYPHIIVDRF